MLQDGKLLMTLNVIHIADELELIKQSIMIFASKWLDVLLGAFDTQAKQGC